MLPPSAVSARMKSLRLMAFRMECSSLHSSASTTIGTALPVRVSLRVCPRGFGSVRSSRGDEAIVCYRQANALQEAITWFGSVQGTSKLPFARQGAGRLIVPRVQSPTKLAVLRGHWWADKLVVRRGEQCSSLMTLDETPTVILRSVNECHMCHEVHSALTTRAHSCGHEPYTWVHDRPGVRPAPCEDQTIPKDQTTLGEFKPGGTHRRLARGSPSLSAHHVRCGRFAQQALRRWFQKILLAWPPGLPEYHRSSTQQALRRW